MNVNRFLFALLFILSLNVWHTSAGGITPPPTDILFLIDGSGSMKKHNFDQLRVLLKNMIDKMSIGPYGSHVALIQFSSRQLTKVEFNLDTYSNRDSYSNKQDIKKAIDDMVYQKKYTYTGYAMEMANKEVFNSRGGDRPNAKNIILLFTDGHSADPHTAMAATKTMKSRGDHLMTVAIGPQKSIMRFKHELEAISSNKEKDVFLNGLNEADNIRRRIFEASLPKSDCSIFPCQNGARCENRGDSFFCHCTGDFKGITCELEKGPCEKNPCLNSGICEETGDEFNCVCSENFHGEICEKEKVVCTTKNADILLILDDSRSIPDKDYSKMKRFVTKLVYRFNISEDQSHVALIQFSSKEDTAVSFNLNRHYNKASLMNDIANLEHSNGDSTYTDVALKMAREEIFNGKQGDRKGVRDVIILLTDGNSHDDDAARREAGLLRDADISIISIGIGKGEVTEKLYNFLKDLSFGSDYVFKVSYTKLETILDGVTTAACENLQET